VKRHYRLMLRVTSGGPKEGDRVPIAKSGIRHRVCHPNTSSAEDGRYASLRSVPRNSGDVNSPSPNVPQIERAVTHHVERSADKVSKGFDYRVDVACRIGL
jgi:hypothetical protein